MLRPGDNPNQCAQGYSCPPPALSVDTFAPIQSPYVDVGAGGPSPFTFTVTSNVTWLKISPASGSISPQNPEERVAIGVSDWAEVNGAQTALLTFNAVAAGQPNLSVTATFTANHTTVPDDFKGMSNRGIYRRSPTHPSAHIPGFVEGDGAVSIEAAHASRNTTVAGVSWTELPEYGRTLSAVTPWPRMGNNGSNFTAGTGPSM